jgi:hypothetical protein
MADSVGQFLDIIDNRIEKHLNNNNCGYLRQRAAVVTEYDNNTLKAFVYFVDDENKTQYTFFNKTGELLSSGDSVKVFYTSNPAKGWIGERCGEPRYDGGYSLEPITSITINSNIDYSVHTNAGIERYIGIFEGE